MSTKVLVFESDAAFAGELRSELGKLGCSTCVVDDGSVGLQQASAERPDLILLSIELPRMNGFSVCNKLKKDATLKDVPLIIMSSESSDETFEQHRKLRTRAEDYVHKPIAFGELLGHIQSFVQVGSPAEPGSDADGIVIDDEISLQHVQEIDDDEEGTETEIAMRPPDFGEPKKTVDPEVDSFTDEVFGRLQNVPPQAAAREANGGGSASPSTGPGNSGGAPPKLSGARPVPLDPRASKAAPPARAAPINQAELERLRTELDRHRGELERAESKAVRLEKEVAQAHEQINRIHQESDAEVERMQRDLHELKSRTSLPPKSGAISSREFLDLREGLNKKDKEILALRTQLTVKDKEIFEARDRALALERQTSELDDKILAKDREIAETGDRVDALTEKVLSREAEVGDLKRLVGEAESEAESRKTQLIDLQAKRVEERDSFEATVATLTKEHVEALARADAEHVKALDELAAQHKVEQEEQSARYRLESEAREAQRIADVDAARREHDLAAEEAQRRAAAAQAEAVVAQSEALAAREGELQREMDSKVATLHRAQLDELTRIRNEAQEELEGARREATEALASREHELERRRLEEVAAVSARAASELADATGRVADLERDLETSKVENRDLGEEKLARDAQNEARIADGEAKLSNLMAAKQSLETEFAVARERIGALEIDLSSVRGELQSTQSRLETQTARVERAFAKWDADKASLERAKDALAVALSQLDEAEARPIQDP
jgi:DNA-binding response OmpR family regulator/DNA repair exonuclease SbcCD ATPase subunit